MNSSTNAFAFETEFSENGDVLNEGGQSYKRYRPDEVEEMCAQARQEGIASVEAETERQIAAQVSTICAHLQPLMPFAGQLAEQMRKEAAELAHLLAKKLAGAALEHVPEAAIEAGISEILSSLPKGPKLILSVDPAVAERLETALEPYMNGSADIQIEAAPGTQPGAWRLEWETGAFSHDPEALGAELEDMIRSYLEQPVDDQGDLFSGVA